MSDLILEGSQSVSRRKPYTPKLDSKMTQPSNATLASSRSGQVDGATISKANPDCTFGRRRLLAAILGSESRAFNRFALPAVILGSAVLGTGFGLGTDSPWLQSASAQDACCFQPSYRLQSETVMQPQTVQRFRIAYETDYVEEEVVSFRPVLRTRTEEREVRVARPVTETSFREERFTVQRPVTETSMRDEQYTQTRYVTETSEREEQVTTMRPVVETQMVQQQHVVQRPVVETQMVQQQHVVQRPVVETQFQTQQVVVQRPVVETQFQTQQHVVQRPVTTFTSQTFEAGGFVNQQVVQPGQVAMGLQWVPRAVQTTGPFGIFSINRGAAMWTPMMTPPTVQNQLVFQSNPVTQQVAQTSFVNEVQQTQVPVQVMRMQNETVSQQVPVQVMRMQNETVTQQVPVQVTRMISETVTQQVPVQTTRMVPTVETRRVPVTVQRPITETLTRQVPVQQTRWVAEEQVRRVPVTSTRIEYETRREPVEVKYFEQERVVQKVRRPVTREVYVPYTETIMVPRQVVQRVPLSYYDPFSSAIISGYSSFGDSSSVSASRVVVPSNGTSSNGEAAQDSTGKGTSSDGTTNRGDVKSQRPDTTGDTTGDLGPSVLEGPSNQTDQPKARLQSIEIAPLTNGTYEPLTSPSGASKEPAASSEPGASSEPSDSDELKAPVLDADSASYRIRYRPLFTREI